MKKIVKIVLITVCIVVITSGCSSNKELQMYKEIVENLNEDIVLKDMEMEQKGKELEANIVQLNEDYYDKKLAQLLGEEELLELAKQNWEYSLEISEREVDKSTIKSSGKEINIVLRESLLDDGALPRAALKRGSLGGNRENSNLQDFITFGTDLTFEVKPSTSNSTTEVMWNFYDVPKGTVINLKLSQELKERLGLDFEHIEIVVDR